MPFKKERFRLDRGRLGVGASRRIGSRGWRTRIVLLCCALIFAASACRFEGLLSRHPDWVVTAEFARYFDLSASEAEALRPTFSLVLGELVRDLGPEVSDFLRNVEQAIVKNSLTAEIFDSGMLKIESWRKRFAGRLIVPVTDFLLGLDNDQVAYFHGQLRGRLSPLEKLLKTSASRWPERSREFALTQMAGLAFWFGPLTAEQTESFVSDQNYERSFIAGQAAERKASQKAWLKILQDKKRTVVESHLRSWLLGEASDGSDAREENRRRWRKAIWTLLERLTAEQRKIFSGRLAEMRAVLDEWRYAPGLDPGSRS